MAGAFITCRAVRIAASMPVRSYSADRKLKRIAGGLRGLDDFTWMLPVLSERSTLTLIVTPRSGATERFGLTRKGRQEKLASGDSSPSRVRK